LSLVERAAFANDAASRDAFDPSPVSTLGPLIHNPQVVADLEKRGVHEVSSLAEVTNGILVIRSHGVTPDVIDAALAKGLLVVDATCPHVSKAQAAARELREQGYSVVVVGEMGHPEVESISAHVGGAVLVVQEPQDLPELLPQTRIGIVVQTTQLPSALEAIVGELKTRGIEPCVRNTICSATLKRQQSAERLAREVDVMVVVGGRNSGNTRRLTEICSAVSAATYHIETARELKASWFVGVEKVGVTAGASTPQGQIDAVVARLEAIGKSGGEPLGEDPANGAGDGAPCPL
jgi:4-hydroxy-3-methylbut-2-enyl diphosphate reductase